MRYSMQRAVGIIEHVGFGLAIISVAVYFIRAFLKRKHG
jgi:hypothetical protein